MTKKNELTPEVFNQFESRLTPTQRQALAKLDSPVAIQAYLDATPYSTLDVNLTPLEVMQRRVANCFDGGLFGALALYRLDYPPLLVDMLPEPGTDDDHILAIFRVAGCLGAVAKSNFAGLRYREPVYRSLRELVMSYFEDFYNVDGLRTLRAYTRPLDLRRYDAAGWMWDVRGCNAIEDGLNRLHPYPLISPAQAKALHPLDELSYKSGTLATNPDGLYKPK